MNPTNLYAQYIDGRAANIRRRSQIRFPNSSNRIDLLTDAELAARGWYKLERDPSLPTAASIITATYQLIGIKILEDVTEFQTAETTAAEAHAARLAEIEAKAAQLLAADNADEYPFLQSNVARLSRILASYGLSIPVAGGLRGAIAQISMMELTEAQEGMLGTLKTVYEICINWCESDVVLTKVWEGMNETKGDQDGGQETT